MTNIDAVLRHLDADFDGAVARLTEFLRIPSVSTDPARAGEVRRAAHWIADQLAALDFSVSLVETARHPTVIAQHPGTPGGLDGGVRDGVPPHILYYGHYDVQPPEPLEEWTTDPFDPTIIDGPHGKRIVARGAVDDKGQVMTFIEALRAWHAVHGGPPTRVTVLIEGEEEIGSANLAATLEAERDRLGADICVVSDTTGWDVDTPALTTRLRGMLYTELYVEGPGHDLHSGLYGGVAPNPLNALTRVLGRLHDDQGRVAIDGFYDDVRDPDPETLAAWAALPQDDEAVMAEIGADGLDGEQGVSRLERLWSRPTCDINGISGGYAGAGSKTVIPARASAKVSFRLVPDQDPDRILAAYKVFIAQTLPSACRWRLEVHSKSTGVEVDTGQPMMAAARAALEQVYGRPAAPIGCGGSIPVVGMMRRLLGIDTILMGFGLDDDRMHSPNEKFELRALANGARSHAAFLGKVAEGSGL
ncbi:M20/M25/M40 family metallo-hydrolase [Fodinicurvata sp. EGI_FJ10296]|uniref:M20/M25/M40 family metallo-hydrolase n=1 Tax=Fodinicurvata sp. EGI_FJ10296 TaxID=3231908 RepID=UPI0034519F55